MNTRKENESFNIREAKGEDFYKIMIVNEALKDFKDKKHYPWLLIIIIDLVNTAKPYNLPTENEAEILNMIEDEFASLLESTIPYQYIGRITDNGKRDIYYYVEDPQNIHEKLSEIIESEKYIREFEYEISNDPDWENVDFFFN